MEASLLTKSSSTFRSEPLVKTKHSLRNRLLGIAKRSNFFQFQRLTFGIPSSEQFHIHTIESGETLTSISKKYGVSIYSIAAANMEIKDVDFVLEGQKLNIPINVGVHKLYSYQLRRCHKLLDENLVPRPRELICTINSSFPSKMTKSSSYFVVLAPLVAFCIGCMIGVFRDNLSKSSRPSGANKGFESYKTRSTRWKAVIYDSENLDTSDAEPLDKSCKTSEEQSQLLVEMPHHGYAKVESEYSKFLSDCGVSSYGYWRGGTTE